MLAIIPFWTTLSILLVKYFRTQQALYYKDVWGLGYTCENSLIRVALSLGICMFVAIDYLSCLFVFCIVCLVILFDVFLVAFLCCVCFLHFYSLSCLFVFCFLDLFAWFGVCLTVLFWAAFKSPVVWPRTTNVIHGPLALQDIIFVFWSPNLKILTGVAATFGLCQENLNHLLAVRKCFLVCVRQWEGVLGLIGGILSSAAGHFSLYSPTTSSKL